MQARRNGLVLQGEHGLDQPGDTRGLGGVSNVGLHRTQCARRRARVTSEGPIERCDLHAVTEIRTRAVSFYVLDGGGIDTREVERLCDYVGLPPDARCRVAGLGRSVVVDGAAPDHGMHGIAVAQREAERAKNGDAGAVAHHRALCTDVERPAPAVGRQNHPLLVQVSRPARHPNRDGTGKRHVAIACQQSLTRHVNGDQPGRAGGLHVDAWAREVQCIGDTRRKEAGGVAHENLESGRRLEKGPRGLGAQGGTDVVHEVGIRTGTRIDADESLESSGVDAGVLQCLPGTLQEDPVLRIHLCGFRRRTSEEGGVEEISIPYDGARLHVGRMIRQRRLCDLQPVVREVRNRLNAVA